MLKRKDFSISDLAQQMVGGFLLAGPFVVTEEVWKLAAQMTFLHSLATVLIVLSIGYGALYQADRDRDPDRETRFLGVPSRFISLILISYLSVAILSVIFTAPTVFEATSGTFFKVISIGSVFSVIGAATADSVF